MQDLTTITFLLTLVQTENKAVKRFIGLSNRQQFPILKFPNLNLKTVPNLRTIRLTSELTLTHHLCYFSFWHLMKGKVKQKIQIFIIFKHQ